MERHVRDLLHASVIDTAIVRQYLQSLEANELDQLFDTITPSSCNNKLKTKTFLVQDEWLPFVRLLLQYEATRLRATLRVIHVLRLCKPSELEGMQLLTEVNMSYSNALDEVQEISVMTKQEIERKKLVEEIHLVLDMVFSFVEDIVSRKEKEEDGKQQDKVLLQLLGLVPYFLGLVRESHGEEKKCLAKLLEMPWSCQTISSLLDVLIGDPSLMAKENWQQLQENVDRMVTTTPELASETMNPIIRECFLVANVTSDHKWIGTARYLLRQLPVHLRQEAEFNLQMSFNQFPRIVALVCKSIQASIVSDEGDAIMKDTNSQVVGTQCGAADLKLDWRDLFLLLHSLQASKPVLHHRTSSSRVATEASVFTEIEQLAWVIVQSELEAFERSIASYETSSRGPETPVEKHVLNQVELVLSFGGKQVHAHEWKALLLMDIVFFWLEQRSSSSDVDNVACSRPNSALLLLQAIFEAAPEIRSEVFSSLFERSQKVAQRKIAGETLSLLCRSYPGKLFPYLNAIQDWLSVQFQQSFDTAREFFLIASRLATLYKDLYNFLMMFLRKLLSSGNRLHQQFAVDMWCTWLYDRLAFNEQQEEEIIAALKNSVIACRDIQAWSFGRLEQVFQCNGANVKGPVISLRKSSWEELQRFLSHEAGKFILQASTGLVGYANEIDADSADEYDNEDSGLLRFCFSSLDAFYQQNASLDGAASTGLLFEKLLSCLIQFEKGVSLSKISSEGVPLEGLNENDSDIKQWLVDLVSNWNYFFHWICQDSDELLNQSAQGRGCEKSAWWKLVARVYIGCAVCNVTLSMLAWKWCAGNSSEQVMINQDQTAPQTDDNGISMWSLMEVEFSLHRMIQKLASHYGNEMDTHLSKEYIRAVSYGLHRVLQPAKLHILTAIKNTLQESGKLKALEHNRPNGMSFEATLFALDSCCSTLGAESCLFGITCAWDSKADTFREATSILEVLLYVYINVRDRIMPGSNMSHDVDVRPGGDETDKSACRQQFALYADSICAKFPTSARHLVLPGKSAKAVVLLDAKGGEEMLKHVCAAIGRTLESMIKCAGLRSVHDILGQSLSKVWWTGDREMSEMREIGDTNNYVRLSRNFLADVNACIQLNGLTKLAVSCASLSKRLLDNAGDIANSDCGMDCSDLLQLSSLAYDIVCDNVVYNGRLLRLLMNICFSSYLAVRIKTFVMLESKIEGIIQTYFHNSAEDVDASSINTRYERRPAQRKVHDKSDVSVRRKRLRQDVNARSSYGLRGDLDSNSDASYSFDSDASDDPNAVLGCIHTINMTRNDETLLQQDRIPHLHSHATQNIAIVAVLTLLEQSQSTLLTSLTTKNGHSSPCSFPPYQEIVSYNRIHDSVNQFITEYRDFSWETRTVLLKVLHLIELGLRIGKASGSIHRRRDDDDQDRVDMWSDSLMSIYESSVTAALRSRVWMNGIKNASQDLGTRTKISATLLKMDIFVLQVPSTVQTWLKETTISDMTKTRLKFMMTVVKERIVSRNDSKTWRHKGKTRQRLIGVIPIVKTRKTRLQSRHPVIHAFLNEEDGRDAFADLEDFIE